MELAVHHPETPQKEQLLRQRVAAAFAQAVLDCIEGLSCSPAQKLALLNAVLETVKAK